MRRHLVVVGVTLVSVATATSADAVSALLAQLQFPMDVTEPLTQRTQLSFHTRCGGLPQQASCGDGGKHWSGGTPPSASSPAPPAPIGGDCYQRLSNGSLAAPPPGLRSAAALGGLGTGSFSLHGDGSFHEWTVEHARVSTATIINKTTVNPARVFLLADAFAGLHVSGSSAAGYQSFGAAFRTEPPSGVPAADGMVYSSASPVTRLQLRDAKLSGVSASLYAHYRWKIGDSNASATPAVVFTLQLTNTRPELVNASLLLSMPLAANEGYSREGPSANETATGCGGPINPGGCRSPPPAPQPSVRHTGVSTPSECQRLCTAGCSSWTLDANTQRCVLQAGRPPQPWRKATNCTPTRTGAGCGLMEGVHSGLAGEWVLVNGTSLTHKRPGTYDASGGITLKAVQTGELEISYSTAESAAAIWSMFASGEGRLAVPASNSSGHGHGAAAATMTLMPGETKTASIVLSWFLPHALYTGEPLGVWYANNFESSEQIADKVAASLEQQLQDAVAWNRLIVNTSLPHWLSALLVNTPAIEMESGFWTQDGRYRQYDNIYAPDLSVHVHMFSMIPFVSFHTALTKDIIKTCQARLQCPQDSTDPACPPGMIQEVCANAGWGNIGCGNSTQNWCGFSVGMMDSGGGRIMGDVTSVFLLETYQVWRQQPDRGWLQSVWPSIIRAVHWQVDRSAAIGLPAGVCTTYDYLEIARAPGQVSSYSGFLYLVSLRAARELAQLMAAHDATGAAALLKTIAVAEPKAIAAIDNYLWVPGEGMSLGYFRAANTGQGGKVQDALMSDSLHANLWSMVLGFGPITNLSRLASHFQEEHARNCAMNNSVGCLGIAHFPKIGRHGSQDVSPSFSMDLTANLFFSKAWDAAAFLKGEGPTTPAETVTKMAADSLHADFFNWRDMYFGPADWAPEGYIPEFMCHNPNCRLKQPLTELDGNLLAGAPFENQRYSRQLSAWYLPLALSGQQWDASANQLSFSPNITIGSGGRRCDIGEQHHFVLPFFFATLGSTGTAAGHLELPRCVPYPSEAGRRTSVHVLLQLLVGRLDGVTVSVLGNGNQPLFNPTMLSLEAGSSATVGTLTFQEH